ncbi:MAG: Holliday junction ATP-dependent DNA helicase RuvA [Candidatus Magasanikbacteria bacterium GW2011_GWC2_34_16]|uniref:Holliday junction branch migration complex subunit RuvA n=2 Tax=Candidatus Magasanikiibacteriota TaxID=1752731 RepID=A0A0G0HD71_9BACT|nr:MAG: Holliday junction ATP-dependent DNA helicase RuvA [Candidatus Magasanikbacteria bacterium GW2011_GWC2_34_16]KKQ41098.1 MAG: Holliday junction ATP-dependent DNA helicase RuvA [Candidatus Magasanikbacteria bacterium GW2011_GWA2_37_8]
MISLIVGKIVSKEENKIVVITAGGIGYEILVNIATVSEWQVGTEVQLLTYLVVRENAMELCGFKDQAERELFLQFLTVTGIGPKSALHLLSLGTVAEISGAISRSDVDYLIKVSGVGRKTAERIVVELKNKINKQGTIRNEQLGNEDGVVGDVVEGLISLGYTKEIVREAVKKIDATNKSAEELMKLVLKSLSAK